MIFWKKKFIFVKSWNEIGRSNSKKLYNITGHLYGYTSRLDLKERKAKKLFRMLGNSLKAWLRLRSKK